MLGPKKRWSPVRPLHVIAANLSDYIWVTTHPGLTRTLVGSGRTATSDQRVGAVPAKAVRASLCLRDEEATARVPVAYPMARYKTVCSGHSRIDKIVSELPIVWSAEHDKPVPKLIVRVRYWSPPTSANPTGLTAAARPKARPGPAQWSRPPVPPEPDR